VQALTTGDQGTVVSNPTPVVSNIPGLAAANSGPVGGVPMWTPPLTPSQGGGSGITGGVKRELSGVEEGEKEEKEKGGEGEREVKRRRIMPTPVVGADGGERESVEGSTATTEAGTPTPTPGPGQ